MVTARPETILSSAEIWEQRFASGALETPPEHNHKADDWLACWLGKKDGPFSNSPTPPPPMRAIDLGCGVGHDTACLLAAGYDVTAIDHAVNALDRSRRRNPRACHIWADLRDLDRALDVPSGPGGAWHLVVANLSLHYFTRGETLEIFASIHAHLIPGALFAFRVNAFDERGAPSDPTSWRLVTETEDGVPRQYFTEDKINAALDGRFGILSLQKKSILYNGREKSLFEVIALRDEKPAFAMR